MLEEILEFLKQNAGIESLAFVFAASASEYVVPPLPADTVIVLSSLLVVAHSWSFGTVYSTVVAGGVLGSILQYFIGYALARKQRTDEPPPLVLRWMGAGRIQEFADLFRKYGYWLILFNRFMPGLRAAVFLACGTVRLNPRRVILLGLVSNLVWSALLLRLGLLLGENFEKIQSALSVYRYVAIAIMIALIGVFAYRKRGQRRHQPGAETK